ncbi:MAG: tyrosine-type recombinase/integrase [Chloroflexi bacterium]|nr:tyrosine-type recombinase/integrase [Chloroflexota bacterium]
MFSNLQGGPLLACEVEHALPPACERLRLPRLTPHGLRHLSAHLALAEGVPLPNVSKRLGHATPRITATIHSHAQPGRDRQAAEALERALGGERRAGTNS